MQLLGIFCSWYLFIPTDLPLIKLFFISNLLDDFDIFCRRELSRAVVHDLYNMFYSGTHLRKKISYVLLRSSIQSPPKLLGKNKLLENVNFCQMKKKTRLELVLVLRKRYTNKRLQSNLVTVYTFGTTLQTSVRSLQVL